VFAIINANQKGYKNMNEANETLQEPTSEIIIYETGDGLARVDVRLDGETTWLTQKQLAALFRTSRPNITMHLQNIFEEGELTEDSVCKDFLLTADDGKKYTTKHYNLDAAISLGYRINSKIATQFRIWATERLKEYIVKGFTMDDERLKNLGGGTYWKELLGRIRDIRSSEKVFYRQVLDLYATAIDYDPNAEESIRFFKIVQNKLHYAAHGHTAAEVIFSRADAEKDFMGLTVFKGSLPAKSETEIAKNYLDEDELRLLNNLVSGYFDLAETQAESHTPMTMTDYIEHLEAILKANRNEVLEGSGSVSHERAIEKAHAEYRRYQVKTLSDVEQAYLETIKEVEEAAKAKVISSTENPPLDFITAYW
jgi:hypothetical protein